MRGRDLALAIGSAILAVLLLGLLGSGMMGYGWGPGMMGGYGFGWAILMLGFWALVIGGIVLLVTRLLGQNPSGVGPGRQGSRETPLDILRERYARGEISKEQFDQMRRDLD